MGNKCEWRLRVNRFHYIKKSVSDGGCSLYRNMSREKEQVILLIKKWGNRIVKVDNNHRNHRSSKRRVFDFNPVINVPIKGI